MAYATVGDLIKAFREDERDSVAPYQWSDTQLVRFANEALTEFAEQTKSIYDDSGDVTQLAFNIGQQEFELHPSIIDVLDAAIGTDSLDIAAPGVFKRRDLPTGGKPRLLVLNPSANLMKLYPAPTLAGTLELTVIRRPLAEVAKDSAIPDIPPDERRHLLLFIKHKALSVPDIELFDPRRATQFRLEFEAACQGVYENAMRRRGTASQPIRFRW